jgi:hypothetical protein
MDMRTRLAALLLLVCLGVPAQMRMTVKQLTAFIKSSVDLKHEDRKVAAYLKKVNMREQLTAGQVEDLQAYGVGPRTLEALEALRDASRSLAPPPPVQPVPAPPAIPPPSLEEQRQIIAQVRDYALNYTKRLPDFICTQVTRRYADPSGLEFWQRLDTLTTKLSYFDQKEDYKVVLVNNQPTDISYDKLGGSISSGEFGTMMREIFEPETEAQFTWTRWATLRGRRVHVYEYRVSQPKSKWRIDYQRSLQYVPGYRGLIYVDRDSLSVARIRLEAEGMPASFPINQASIELDYDTVDIAGAPYVLPLKHTMRMREAKLLIKNEVEFRMYRKFGAEAVITFDTPDPLSEDKTREEPAQPQP